MATQRVLVEWSFIATVVGAILVLVGGLMGLIMMGVWGGWMMGDGLSSGQTPYGPWWGVPLWLGLVSGATAIVALLAAPRIRTGETGALNTWGIVVIAAGAINFLPIGGSGLGAGLVVAGGVLAVAASQREEGAVGNRG